MLMGMNLTNQLLVNLVEYNQTLNFQVQLLVVSCSHVSAKHWQVPFSQADYNHEPPKSSQNNGPDEYTHQLSWLGKCRHGTG